MLLHNDLSARALVDSRTAAWVPSPEPGVERLLLDRDGGEVARATSIVRYAPGSRFAAHAHGRGEEILVLDGELCDEYGSYPRGTYLRSPWGSRHAPFSNLGCTLFAKLRQIPESDATRVCVRSAFQSLPEDASGERAHVLHQTELEWVALVRFGAGHSSTPHDHPNGEEILVIDGSIEDEHGTYRAGSWLRQPRGSQHQLRSIDGCLLYMKRGLL
jgi:anti-sigma factor ChrR (cupin superfamily)